MSSSKTKTFLKKIFSLLSVIRGYNILVLIIAQYLASIFIFSPKKSIRAIIFDFDLLYIVLASVCTCIPPALWASGGLEVVSIKLLLSLPSPRASDPTRPDHPRVSTTFNHIKRLARASKSAVLTGPS